MCSVLSTHFLSSQTDLFIWHGDNNNSIGKHSSNNNRALSSEQLKSLLLQYKQNYLLPMEQF